MTDPSLLAEWSAPFIPVAALTGMSQLHPQLMDAMPSARVLPIPDDVCPSAIGARATMRPTPLLGNDQLATPERLRVLCVEDLNWLPEKQTQRKSIPPMTDTRAVVGFIKTNWVAKHTRVLPAVVAALFEWDDADSLANWRGRETAICNALDAIKYAVRGRGVRILVVLVMNKRPVPGDNSSEERLASLRKRADLDGRAMLTLQIFDFKASAARLERAMHESAIQYYRDEGHRVKKVSERFSKTSQGYLIVRSDFKTACYSEFRGDVPVALKYYEAAYQGVAGHPRSDATLGEIRAVAEALNYKICRLALAQGNVNGAVLQFRRLLAAFRAAVGAPDLAFRHWAWLAAQCRAFGELLETVAPPAALAPSEDWFHHPAYYYQAAASYSARRRDAARILCAGVAPAEGPEEECGPWVGVPDGARLLPGAAHPLEREQPGEYLAAVKRAQAAEAGVDHSALIIALLWRAYQPFKAPSSASPPGAPLADAGRAAAWGTEGSRGRVVLHIAFQMGREYHLAGDHRMAKKFLDNIAREYRREGWAAILTDALSRALECAARLGLLADFVEYAIELLTPALQLPQPRRERLAAALARLVKAPVAAPGVRAAGPDALEGLPDLAAPHFVELPARHPFLRVAVRFAEAQVPCKAPVEFHVRLLMQGPCPLRFTLLRAVFSDAAFRAELQGGPDREELRLEPGEARTFTFRLSAREPRQVECTEVQLWLGQQPSCLVFRWDIAQRTPAALAAAAAAAYGPPESPGGAAAAEEAAAAAPPEPVGADGFVERPVVRLLPPEPGARLEAVHAPPALVGELYLVHAVVHAETDRLTLAALELRLSQPAGGPEASAGHGHRAVFTLPEGGGPPQPLDEGDVIPVPDVAAGGRASVPFLLRAAAAGTVHVAYKLRYTAAGGERALLDGSFALAAVAPFAATFRFLSPASRAPLPAPAPAGPAGPAPSPPPPGAIAHSASTFSVSTLAAPAGPAAAAAVEAGAPFLLVASVESASPHPLLVEELALAPPAERGGAALVSAPAALPGPQQATRGDRLAACFLLRCPAAGPAAPLGALRLRWRRLHQPTEAFAPPAAALPKAPSAAGPASPGRTPAPPAPSTPLATPPRPVSLSSDPAPVATPSPARPPPEPADGHAKRDRSYPAHGPPAERGPGAFPREAWQARDGPAAAGMERAAASFPAGEAALPVPPVAVEPARFSVALESPGAGRAGEPFGVRVRVANETGVPQEVVVHVLDSDAFVVAGPKLKTLALPPRAAASLSVTMAALAPGHLALPRIELKSVRYDAHLPSSRHPLPFFAAPASPAPPPAPAHPAPLLA